MIVRDIMTTKLVTVEPDDTLSHATNLLRQYQFHHLPVVRKVNVSGPQSTTYTQRHTELLFEGLLTSQDIELAVALADQESADGKLDRPWQDRKVLEVMHRDAIQVSPVTSVGAAAQLLVERGQNCLPVVEYSQSEQDTSARLVGLLTRSDLLLALARAMGAFEPGMDLVIFLPTGSMVPLKDGVPRTAMLRVGTINPSPLLLRLQAAGIQYTYAHQPLEGKTHV